MGRSTRCFAVVALLGLGAHASFVTADKLTRHAPEPPTADASAAGEPSGYSYVRHLGLDMAVFRTTPEQLLGESLCFVGSRGYIRAAGANGLDMLDTQLFAQMVPGGLVALFDSATASAGDSRRVVESNGARICSELSGRPAARPAPGSVLCLLFGR